ncbi:hypothetical protein CAL7102_01277 [Dulcicalothrix desertica PCC 7102]|nr:hypothetical protein CAL7102_01277 [Dulcicalothrix desertica PCC 7102]
MFISINTDKMIKLISILQAIELNPPELAGASLYLAPRTETGLLAKNIGIKR